MSSPKSNVGANTVSVPEWDEELAFGVFADPMRRRVLVALAKGGPQTAVELMKGQPAPRHEALKRMHFDVLLKHLGALVSAGMAVTQVDSRDRRRRVYGLSPRIKVTIDGKEMVFDFGFCVMRLP